MNDWDLYLFSALFILAGCMHFVFPKPFSKIVPPSLPRRVFVVYISGFFEIIFGVGLLFPLTQELSAVGLVVLLIAVFPANIYMAKRFKEKQHPYTWATYLRLPLQIVLIYWALLYTGEI